MSERAAAMECASAATNALLLLGKVSDLTDFPAELLDQLYALFKSLANTGQWSDVVRDEAFENVVRSSSTAEPAYVLLALNRMVVPSEQISGEMMRAGAELAASEFVAAVAASNWRAVSFHPAGNELAELTAEQVWSFDQILQHIDETTGRLDRIVRAWQASDLMRALNPPGNTDESYRALALALNHCLVES